MARDGTIQEIFGAPRALIGVLHVRATPGSPAATLPVGEIAAVAVSEAREYERAGFHGLILENMHDRPYLKGSVGPEVTATMAVVGRAVRDVVHLPLGVQVLAAANHEALAVAQACGGAFVRTEGLVFAHVADEGLIESDAGAMLRYRKAIGAENVRIFSDVKKKHSAHALTADVDLAETARAAEFFLADGLVVTGTSTGRPTDPADLAAVRAAVEVPVLIGSGITAANLSSYAAADAWIVGSSVKQGGLWSNELDPASLDELVAAFSRLPTS